MPTEADPPDGLELETTAEMPLLPGYAASSGADRLAATDSWRVLPQVGDEPLDLRERTVPGYDRRALEQQVRDLERRLRAGDERLAALTSELELRDTQLRQLDGQLSGLREELLQARARVEQLLARAPEPAAAVAAAEGPKETARQRLLVSTASGSDIVHLLARRTTVGRTPDNDLRVEAHYVSRHHAVLLLAGTDTVLEDLHSTNGTFVNGELITRRTLRDGDVVTFGKMIYRFVVKPLV
jgi:hypothetical protein